MSDLELAQRFLTSLGIGLLMGLERQRSPTAYAGLRTFPLVALLGTLLAMLDQLQDTHWLLPVGLGGVTWMMISAYRDDVEVADPGTTTTAALMLCFGLGALSWHGQLQVAVALALAATTLLHYREELHGFAQRLSRNDIFAVLRFLLVAVLLLPLLPDRGYGPYEALNPHRIWMMVVLISGLSLGGYLLLQLVGAGRAAPLLGVLGGLASSTATTLSFARQVRADAGQAEVATTIVLIANLMVFVRLLVLAMVLAPALVAALLPPLGAGLAAGGAMVLLQRRRQARGAEVPSLNLSNPSEMRAALGFGLLYGAVLLLVAFLQDRLGSAGIYAAAAVSGLTDVDAISLSVLERFAGAQVGADVVVNTMIIAVIANLVFKGVAAIGIAGRALLAPLAMGFGAMATGLLPGKLIAASVGA